MSYSSSVATTIITRNGSVVRPSFKDLENLWTRDLNSLTIIVVIVILIVLSMATTVRDLRTVYTKVNQ